MRIQIALLTKLFPRKHDTWLAASEADAARGRWYHLGTDRACRMLENFGYEVVCPDLGINYSDPVVHFRKP